MSRTPWYPTEGQLREIVELAAKGAQEQQISAALGLNKYQFSRKKNDMEDTNLTRINDYGEKVNIIQEAIIEGKGRASRVIMGKMWDIINDPSHRQNGSMIMFWLKCHGWIDRPHLIANKQARKAAGDDQVSDDDVDNDISTEDLMNLLKKVSEPEEKSDVPSVVERIRKLNKNQ